MDLARALVREPDVGTPAAYRRRVTQLALIYLVLCLVSTAGIVVVLWNSRLFVTLAQRSNVETLVVAFILLLFAYLSLVSMAGARGALRLFAWRARGWLKSEGERLTIEGRKARALPVSRRGPSVALNWALVRADKPGEPLEIPLEDGAGSVGRLVVSGVRVTHLDAPGLGSNDLLAFFVRQVIEVMALDADDLDVVAWHVVDEEGYHQYASGADAFIALGRHLKAPAPLWPHLAMTPDQCRAIAERLSAVCTSVRDEGFLPRREFAGEHKIPIIPEPLGIVSLARQERRVDPLSSMGGSLIVVAVVFLLLVLFVVRPPWVPGG